MLRAVLPTREWIARITPEDKLEEIAANSIPQARTIWNDEFDNVFDLSRMSSHTGLSRKQLCRMQKSISNHSHGGSVRDIGQRNSLLIDRCFVDGLVEGFDAVLMVTFVLAFVAMAIMAVHFRLRLWRSKRRNQLAYRTHNEQLDTKIEA